MEFVLYSVTGTPDGGESYDIALGEPLCRIGTLRIREISEKVDSNTPFALEGRTATRPWIHSSFDVRKSRCVSAVSKGMSGL